MPVTKFQAKIAKLLSVNRSPDSHLAGGAAMHFEPQTLRYSNDLDYFHDSEQRVATAFNDDQALLLKNKYSMQIEMNQPGFIRAIVSQNTNSTKVEWSYDSAWRFMPTVFSEDRGYHLHPVDLATNKVLTLAGRDEARDYLDVHEANNKILALGTLIWAACGKDPGFTPHSLYSLLQRKGKYHEEDFSRLHLNIPINLLDLKTKWLEMLKEAEDFINQRPADEVGCLYYSCSQKQFVIPSLKNITNDIKLHYASLGGILPKVG
ncbi:MAG: hypothetical protein ABIA04_08380 [Pseudomonadota bacterium]